MKVTSSSTGRIRFLQIKLVVTNWDEIDCIFGNKKIRVFSPDDAWYWRLSNGRYKHKWTIARYGSFHARKEISIFHAAINRKRLVTILEGCFGKVCRYFFPWSTESIMLHSVFYLENAQSFVTLEIAGDSMFKRRRIISMNIIDRITCKS